MRSELMSEVTGICNSPLLRRFYVSNEAFVDASSLARRSVSGSMPFVFNVLC